MKNNLTTDELAKIDQLENYLIKKTNHFFGYPVTFDFDYSCLYKFLKYPMNNIGDSYYEGGSYQINTHDFEREVIDFYAQLFNAPENDYWGYITNGSTEGNLYALYLTKRLYPSGVVYFSEECHYSIEKNIDLLSLRSEKIKALENGEIDYSDLEKKIKENKTLPAILIANIGTTVKEAKDDIKKIQKILKIHKIKDHYIHCDAAFCGSFAQFLTPKPSFDFSEGADSIIISGHKFIGSPIPCGIIIVRKSNKEKVSNYVNIIDSLDDTITGSRNAISALFMWYAIKTIGKEGLKSKLLKCLKLTSYTFEKILNLEVKAWRNPNALTILIPRVSKKLQNKWQVATHGELSHIIIKPGITKNMIDKFLLDLEKEFKMDLALLE
ncbi:histidine decarboxylase [Chryseobacterium sp. MMS23-Vi53]|uniref:histidine decarboxylase n=1 Tax=Chryseobacterium sp. MMS23-Vi53 TaxID=3386644 RepID=UPI0039EA3F0A